uniref:AMP-activated protein kinase glycogen-binding domain-containing protein n=1 Tax=Branchiostoma floridae TaxID=7739 RepID=C3YCP9_BRAFL|eukprot:XP_002605840.1 hypothetical protein BRAFLDRAFT_84325 [Branchiostoma floridae]
MANVTFFFSFLLLVFICQMSSIAMMKGSLAEKFEGAGHHDHGGATSQMLLEEWNTTWPVRIVWNGPLDEETYIVGSWDSWKSWNKVTKIMPTHIRTSRPKCPLSLGRSVLGLGPKCTCPGLGAEMSGPKCPCAELS